MEYTQIIFDIALMVFLGCLYYQDKTLYRRIDRLEKRLEEKQ